MSRAGVKSDQGDDYQRFIALHWMIRLINDEEIKFVQAQSTGLPDVDEKITVDDIVVCYNDGQRLHIQAKKNQSTNRCWNLTDLKDELPKILAQLESSPQAIVALYSRTPFGEFASLVEAGREYPDFAAFNNHIESKKLQETLVTLAACWDLSLSETFTLLRRIKIGPPHTFDGWNRDNLENLQRLVNRPATALEHLESFLNTHQSKLRASSFVITRDDILDHLSKHGCIRVPLYDEAEILEQFQRISAIGRNDWQRTVGGQKIQRPEFDQVMQHVEESAATILITDRPGSGKTCLLLDLADHIEKDDRYGLLFIKGDRFVKESSTIKLPKNIPGLCARLSEKQRVVVILDSLDVLSMNREHGALESFLALIDQLQLLPKVSVIAACRSFDLHYDPLLRDRSWQKTVSLTNFDYEKVVAPLLRKWSVNEDELEAPLQELLQLPQNLRLFETVAYHGGPYNIRSVHELHETYLEEGIIKDPLFGEAAMQILRELADTLLREREQSISQVCFSIPEEIRRSLISCGVLHQDDQGKIGFGHQTLLDNLAAKSAFHSGQTLAGFITSHPPFPFIRPAVRSFAFHLRAYSAKKFRQQIRAALSDPNLAYHFKRLLAESLIEITPDADDRSFINRLMRQEPELFRRFFWRLNSDAWFSWLSEHWLPNLGSVQEDRDWYALFASKLEQWQNAFPEEVLALWQRAFAEGWDEKNNLLWRASSLDKFQHWHVGGIDSLLKLLLDESSDDTHFLGKAISQYVAATGQGDDLLWRFITKDLSSEDMTKWNIGQKLHCDEHNFHQKDFLKQRMLASEYLLNLALNDLQKWADAGVSDYDRERNRRPHSIFLSNTSWSQTHHQLDHRHVDNFTILLYIVEQVLKHHSRENTAWWQEHEPQLRQSWEEAILYLLLLAYKENLEANIAGIVTLLSDKNLLRYGRLKHELGKLAGISFHLLAVSDREAFQKNILSLYDEDCGKEASLGIKRIRYDYLIWIPVVFRLPEAQHLIDQLAPPLGSPLPLPQVYLSSIDNGPIVSLEKLLQLSDTQLFRLLLYYDSLAANNTSKQDMYRRTRRWDAIESVLSEAAGYDPLRYFALLQEFEIQKLNAGYSTGILQGISNHLRYRFGNLNPPDKKWKHVEPPPDGLTLTEILINSAEQFAPLWQDGYAIKRIIEACCEMVEDTALAERLVFLLFRLRKHPNPEKVEQKIFTQGKEGISTDDLLDDTRDTVRGIAASSAMTLCNRLLEKDIELPELLFPLLRCYALDHVQSVRAALLNNLPMLTYQRHAWGWQLFEDIFRDTPTLLWPLAERHFYHQYHNHFDKVAPCLDRIQQEVPAEAGEAWGRISALASLDGHLTQDSLFVQLEQADQSKQWKGAAQVFAANIERHNDTCMKGLRRILEREDINKETLSSVSNAFNLEKNGKLLDAGFAVLFIRKIQVDNNRLHCSQLFDWIAWLAQKDAEASINVLECLLEKFEDRKENINQLYDTKAVLSALTSILREADESEDEAMINRAVRLQDQFLRMDLHGMEEFLEQAAII